MPVNLSQFIQTLNKFDGAAKTNHFLVEIAAPPVLSSLTSTETLSLLCQATSLPGVQIGTDDSVMPYGYGVVHKMPWGVVFSDIDLSFFGDARGIVHNMLTQWLNSIVMFNTDSAVDSTTTGQPFFVSYKNTYATTVTIKSLDDRNNSIMEFKLHDCYPTAVYEVGGDWGAQNDIVRIRTRFTFSRWTVSYQKLTSEQQTPLRGLRGFVDNSLNNNRVFLPEGTSDIVNEFRNATISLPQTQSVTTFVDGYKRALPLLGGNDYFKF